jgi:hypothetical protein
VENVSIEGLERNERNFGSFDSYWIKEYSCCMKVLWRWQNGLSFIVVPWIIVKVTFISLIKIFVNQAILFLFDQQFDVLKNLYQNKLVIYFVDFLCNHDHIICYINDLFGLILNLNFFIFLHFLTEHINLLIQNYYFLLIYSSLDDFSLVFFYFDFL